MHKLQTDAAVAEYEAELVKIIESATEQNKRVPPGIFAEYAYIHGKRGDLETAREYFHRELALYPESEKYITFVLDQLGRESQVTSQ